ncbi:hypothetical protein [Cohnella sp. GCM10012308]|uniref:hypothetical protein n=1 Tax=Cohnella sp. GCM10012308 TaxID=3317329 RepID=UPI003609D23F
MKELLNMPEREKNTALPLCMDILQDEHVRDINKTLSQITNDTGVPAFTRESTLARIRKFVFSAKQHLRVNTGSGEYLPPLSEMQLVTVNFAGLGSELNDLHFGIIWDVDRKRDHVSIIPTTSFKPGSTMETGVTFNLGNVGPLTGETVVLMNQITTVSRKRVQTNRFRNPATSATEVVKLSSNQKQRVYEGFRIYGLKEETLYTKHIRNAFPDTVPVFEDPEVQFTHLHRPFIEVSHSKDELIYKLYSDPNTEYKMTRQECVVQATERGQLVRAWVAAKAQINQSTQAIIKSRLDVQKDAYAALISKIRPEPENPASTA